MKKILISVFLFGFLFAGFANAFPPGPPSTGSTTFASEAETLAGTVTDKAVAPDTLQAKFETLPLDNSTANNLIAKDSDGEIENLTLDAHLSRSGTTTQLLSVVTPTIDGSAGTGPTAAQMTGNGCIVSNYGQAASDVAVALPAAAAALSGLFVVGTAQANKWGVQAAANDKIYLIAAAGTIAAGSDNGYARMTAAQIGQSFACWTFQTGASAWDWMCKEVSIGTSTFAAN